MWPGADIRIIVGPGDVKLLKEHGRHIVVVMLTGMHQHFVLSPQGAADGRSLDELGSRADDGDEFQSGLPPQPMP